MRHKCGVVLLSILGLAAGALVHGPALQLTLAGCSDFMSFYAGGKLAGTPDLYDRGRAWEIEHATTGRDTNRPFIRLPYYALLMWPLSRLPYLYAVYSWTALSILAAAWFVWSAPGGSREAAAIACCWSLPLFFSMAQGQDVVFVLGALAAAVFLVRKKQPYIGGLVFALCAAKFHIFLLAPLWIAVQKRWRFGLGFTAGAAILMALSFFGGGPGWPSRYVAMLSNPIINSSPETMPNLHGLVSGLNNSAAWEVAGALSLAALALWSFSRLNFEYSVAMMVATGLFIGHHAYVADCALLLPGALIVWSTGKTLAERTLAALLLAPITYIGMWLGRPAMMFTPLALLSFVGLLAWRAWRRPCDRSLTVAAQ